MEKQKIIFVLILIFLNIFVLGCIDNDDLSIEYFNVQPIVIQKGDNASLIWKVKGADSALIDNNIGKVNLNNSIKISPTVNTTYTITAIKGDEIVNSSVSIIVEFNKKENERETPNVIMRAKSFNENKSVLVVIKEISKFGIEWATVSGKLIDDYNEEIIQFVNIDWKPNGIITEGDEIIISNSMIKSEFIQGNNYSFLLTYQLTNELMGSISWIQ